MEVRIHAVDELKAEILDRVPKGKSTSVRTDDFTIDTRGGRLMIRARVFEPKGSGDRGGMPTEVQRTLTIRLTAEDLKKIVNEALNPGLLRTAVRVPTANERRPTPTRGARATA